MNRRDGLSGSSVLLTGATGLIGGEILRRLLLEPAKPRVRKLFCLVRSPTEALARERLCRRLGLPAGACSEGDSLVPVVGDMALPGLGLSDAATRLLRREADVVVNCAAVTSFVKPAACETVNVAGLKNLLDLAAAFEKPVLFVSFGSTAACGRRSDSCLSEEDYPRPGVGHLVHYTRTKASAEELLRRQSVIPDWLILRPSIVLPDNVAEGRLARGIAWALVVMKEVRCLPVRSTARVDAVPLSFVGECALQLIAKVPRAHNCYHISAGPARSAVWAEVLALLRETYGSDTVCCDPSRWPVERRALTARERRLFRRVSPYVPFINQNLVFANDRLYRDLSGQPPELPHFRSYLPRILKRIALDDALLEGRDP